MSTATMSAPARKTTLARNTTTATPTTSTATTPTTDPNPTLTARAVRRATRRLAAVIRWQDRGAIGDDDTDVMTAALTLLNELQRLIEANGGNSINAITMATTATRRKE
jgi:hypothetical protein